MPITRPNIDERFNLKLKVTISRLNPIGPVKFFVITERTGKKLTRSVPRADPRIAPIIMNAKK